MIEMRPASPDMVDAFVAAMTDADRTQYAAPDAILRNAIDASVHTFAGVVDGVPAFIGGVRADQDGSAGQVWMVGNPRIERAKKFYLRETRAQVAHMSRLFPRLYTFVDAHRAKSLRWLRWLGFRVSEPFEWRGARVVQVEKTA